MSVVASTRTKFRVVFDRSPQGVEVDIDAEPVFEERFVWADQRDFSALERNRGVKASDLPRVESTRWAVHHAGRRSCLRDWPATPEEFERICVEVEPVEQADVDPTPPAPEAGSSPGSSPE